MEEAKIPTGNGWASAQRRGAETHVCNCIGCCQKCGHCRTDPKHTKEACKEIQRANEIKRKALK